MDVIWDVEEQPITTTEVVAKVAPHENLLEKVINSERWEAVQWENKRRTNERTDGFGRDGPTWLKLPKAKTRSRRKVALTIHKPTIGWCMEQKNRKWKNCHYANAMVVEIGWGGTKLWPIDQKTDLDGECARTHTHTPTSIRQSLWFSTTTLQSYRCSCSEWKTGMLLDQVQCFISPLNKFCGP